MADTVTSQVLENGSRNLVMMFTNISDGTGEDAVLKVDPVALGLTTSMKVRRIDYNVTYGAVQLMWQAPTPVNIAYMQGYGTLDLTSTQGITNDAANGTGGILLSTGGFNELSGGEPNASTPASGYTIVLHMIKGNAANG